MVNILIWLRSVIYHGFPRKKTARIVLCENLPYRRRLVSVVLYAKYKEEQAIIRNSIIMPNSVIGKHSVVDRCILDEEVNIGKFCYVGFGSGLVSGGSNITVLGRGVSVPSGTAIGRSQKVLPETKLMAGIKG